MRKHILVLLSVILTVSLTGCASLSRPDASVRKQETVTLRVAWWGNPHRNELTAGVIEKYIQQNPHVEIEYEYSGFNEYWKKMAPLAAGNALPDVMQMDISYLRQYGSLNLLEDLTPYTQNGLIDTAHISERHLSGGRLDGRLFGFNLGVNALNGLYDPEVFRANGIAEPPPGWTWSDFDAMGEQLKGKGVYLGTAFTPEQFFSYYLRQHGSSLFAEDGTRLGYEDDRLFIDYFGRMQRMARDKLIYSPDIWTSDINNLASDPFNQGQALLGWGYSNQFIDMARIYGKPLKIVPMPGPHTDKGLFLKPGMFFSITKSSKHKEEAARFISYFVNDLEANKLMKGDRGVPVSSKVIEGMLPHLEPELAQVFEYLAWVEKNSAPMDPPDPLGSSEVTKVLRDLYDQLLFDRVTPETAAAEFRRKANGILSMNRSMEQGRP
ncbi:family 1 extracellular solute-binding protein [Paenibacillus mucilaginosus 3016]|uniref:Family 1 extracellular solute-binding protein n=2 Tax=Paenibacillus mucilaginosus TaxID=61624 RepID=H6NHZ6_9BACL|nr:extracellular solute-binding protein [Paenibacillus mucilaginosus]AFC30767.1 family 1 extracellular solute-binding protein [Paenibacillus mucilaginosus 3016]AFH63090.2 sugar ABC transporter substrate-binding protein [Paenibacillus mucilaginosus K02]WFA19374.1 extracellular solute-binding protein [Paenibacillus mucilaginosus]